MKPSPPHLSHANVGHLAMLVLTVAIALVFVLSMAGGGDSVASPLDQPLEAPAGFGL